MNALNEARPCALCLAKAGTRDVVVGLYRQLALADHVATNHPNYDPASVWAMPLPGGPRTAEETA